MVKIKTIVYTGLIVGGLGIIAYLVYALKRPAERIVEVIKEVFTNIREAGESLGSEWALENIVAKHAREFLELKTSLTNSAKINSYYITSWYNKYHLWFWHLLNSNEYILERPQLMNRCKEVLAGIEKGNEILWKQYVEALPWDEETQLPPLEQQPEFIREVIEERISVP